MSVEEGIRVFVRVRPQNKKEQQLNRSAVEVDAEKRCVLLSNKGDGKQQQEHVFNTVGQPMCEAVLQGFNSTIFAYGQTGAGKTHTMLGSDESGNPLSEESGLIPRVFHYIFARIEEMKAEAHVDSVVCKCSYLEIYNEVVSDLLSDSASNIVIRDDPRKGVVIEGDSQMTVTSAANTLQALALGSQNRKVAATCMNKESSRSHCCFALSVQITTKEDGITTRKFSRFNLIDLAGSERQKATNATGDRLKEANNINRSLSALGNVIMALANSNGHVPYRDSKLTFMLKDSIGGNSKTCIIANCSPAQECLDETLSTLKFVRFAKLVRNMATVNSESAGGAEALKREIARLKAALAERDERLAAGSGTGAGDGVPTAQLAEEELLPNQAEVVARVLAREAEARAALEAEKADAEVKMSALRSLTSAQEKQILGAKMAVRLKNEYISHLEQRNEVSWPEREAALKLEIEDLQKSLTANPDLIRQTMRIAALSAQVEEMEEEMEESGSEKASERVAALEKDVVQLSEVVHTLLNGKMAAEERMEQLLSENDDRRETIEHLQVMLSDNEFSLAAKDSELAQARDAIAGIEARAAEQQRAHEALEVQLRGAVGELETERLHAGKVAESLAALEQEHDELQAQQARTAQQAQDLAASVKAGTAALEASEQARAAADAAAAERAAALEAKVAALEAAAAEAAREHSEEVAALSTAAEAAAKAAAAAAKQHAAEVADLRAEAEAAEVRATEEMEGLRRQIEEGRAAMAQAIEKGAAKAAEAAEKHAAEMQAAQGAREELEEALAGVQAQLAAAREELEATGARLADAEVKLAETRAALGRTEGELEATRAEATVLAADKDAQAAEIARLTTYAEEVDARVAALEASSKELQKEKKTAEKEVTKLSKDLTKLQKQHDALATKRDALKAEVAALSAEKSELLVAAEAAARERAELQARIEAQAAEAVQLVAGKSKLQRAVEGLEGQLRKAEETRTRVEAALTEAERQGAELKQVGEELTARNKELGEAAWRAEEARRAMDERRAVAEAQAAAAAESEAETQVQLQAATAALRASEDARAAAERAADEAARALAEEKRAAAELGVELTTTQKECHRKENALGVAEGKLEKAKEAAASAKERHEAAAEELRSQLEAAAAREAAAAAQASADARAAAAALAGAEARAAELEAARAAEAVESAALAKARVEQEERAARAEALAAESAALEEKSRAAAAAAARELREAGDAARALEAEVDSLKEGQKLHEEAMENLAKVAKERDAERAERAAREAEARALEKRLEQESKRLEGLQAEVADMTDKYTARLAELQAEHRAAVAGSEQLVKDKDAIAERLAAAAAAEEGARAERKSLQGQLAELRASLAKEQKRAEEAHAQRQQAEAALLARAEAAVCARGGDAATRHRTVLGPLESSHLVNASEAGSPSGAAVRATPLKSRLRGSRATLSGETSESPKMDR